MGLNLSDFKAEFFKSGYLPTNSGHCVFSSPSNLRDKYPETKKLQLRAHRFDIPGVWLTSDDSRRYGYGPIDKTPHLAQFDKFTADFVLDENGWVQDYFYTWMNRIVNFNFKNGIKGSEGGGFVYESSYKQDFVTDIAVKAYKKNKNTSTHYTMIRAWPSSLSPIEVNWGATNQMMVLRVTFEYQDWYMEIPDPFVGIDYLLDDKGNPNERLPTYD